MVDFPQELVNAFIDHLVEDRVALLTCLSVSNSFRCRAQFHLFLTIHLTEKSDFDEFNLLCAISPSIPDLVKTLHVTLPESTINLPRLLRVHTLHFNGSLRVVPGGLESFSRIFSWVPSTLTSLSIQDITFSSIETFRSLIGALPLLKSVSIITAFGTRTGSEISRLLGASCDKKGPPIEILSITSINSDGICGFFHGFPCLGPFALHGLRELHFFGFVLEHAADIQHLLNASRDTLRELHLAPTCFYPSSRWSDKQILDVSHIPIITLRMRGNWLYTSWGLNWLVTCLEKGSYPPRVEQIVIIIDNQFPANAWMGMDKALCCDPNLRAIQVTIALGGHIGRDTLADRRILSAMPGLYSEERVRVDYMMDKP
ncbi:hypothetical protein IW261DRAFT_306139 [Armillaria novae-zelandiae]|uniref:Uncharacterized protein n=1 Tax=Armillaria novae-zelandiae TaxID=153914 RepID=A0AA39P4P3_9AGAR|nr:hypothetical protein IW261DRAFT_306139 [Armillaria novae-zelandiae]